MNVLYEEGGAFKVGVVLSEHEASLHVEAPHGKRAKIKAANVLLRFEDARLDSYLDRAEALAHDIDTGFLWEVCGEPEFGFLELAKEYCGRVPTPLEAAAILVKLHAAPMYFHRKGRGRFKAASPETLKAALTGLERKRQQQEQIETWVAELKRFEFPDALRAILPQLLYKPDRNRIETKAFEQACEELGLSPAKLVARCGALPSTHDYHLGRFLFEHYPQGAGFPDVIPPPVPTDLPVASVAAFSLDDATTTEIDDALSLTRREDGLVRIGIHIAAPGLGFAPASDIDRIARERLSTAYMPGNKITMLPPAVVDRFSLTEGAPRAAVSLYLDVDPSSLVVRGEETRIERVPIAENLRHHEVDLLNDALAEGHPAAGVPFAGELEFLHRFATVLEAGRGKAGNQIERREYSFYVENDRVTITERKRGSPLDKLVAELMILVNRSWGRVLHDRDVAAIYRAQGDGKVRMTTVAAEHQGLGVSHYAWSSSPLRRYVDLVNQWQLLACLRGEPPPFGRKSAELLAVVRDFEVTYAALDEFQRRMEHYWCLRWLLQEGVTVSAAEVVRENVVKFEHLPLYVRVPSLPELPAGTPVEVEVAEVDLIDTHVRCVYKRLKKDEKSHEKEDVID
jgi:exoribonuclease-2